ncbi:kinase-like protein [Gyrodon lividus]|nr:kinase-like protein [Gyrodon lividus]
MAALSVSSLADLSGKVSKIGEHPVGGGGYGDVWKGVWGNRWVAIKVVRTYVESDGDEAIKVVNQEIKAWSRLKHDNVLPLAGVCYDFGFAPALVSIWMDYGTANHYLKEHPEANYLALLSGIAAGLRYLHQENVIHGDLKGDNVLVTSNGVPCLSDFGLSKILLSSGLLASATAVKGTWRWMARELADYRVEHAKPDEKSDVWAFGMTALVCLQF